LHGTGTFALEPPDEAEMLEKFCEIRVMRLPYLVSVEDGAVTGFAYAAPFRTRPAYRYGVEDSVYIAPEHVGKGHGRALLEALIERCVERGLYGMIAVIGDADNAASIGVHRALGFTPTGHIPRAGFKFGRWLDVVFMARDLLPRTDRPEGPGWAE
ncbi:MAG: N-acetyltransferase family protein, partial [Asticcacaulis sp.]